MRIYCWAVLGLVACGGIVSHDRTSAAGDSGAGGGGAGDSGSAGNGGVAGKCDLSVAPASNSGPCEAIVTRFWHDPLTGLCTPVLDNWCAGGDGLFAALADCQATCGGGGASWGSCAHDGDCMAYQVFGDCLPQDLSDFSAVNQAHLQEALVTYMGSVPMSCSPAGQGQRTFQFFLPRCRAGLCTVIDVRSSELSACQSDADCILRDGAECCSDCDSRDLVAVSRDAQLCDVPTDCYVCSGLPRPPIFEPTCAAGHCQVTQAL